MNVDTLQALDTSAQGIAVKMSIIPHPEVRLGEFASRTIGKDEMARYFYDILVYVTFIKEHRTTRTNE